MLVTELSREQLNELKTNYYSQLVDEGIFAEVMGVDIDEPSYEMLEKVNEYISDEFIFENYDGIYFTDDDFWCSCQ